MGTIILSNPIAREDRHAPKGLSRAEHVWIIHNGRSVYALLY